jgi:HlyD family secretion protein
MQSRHKWPIFRPQVLLGVAVVLAIAAVIGTFVLRSSQGVTTRAYQLVTPHNDTLTAIVSANGQIEPDQTVHLSLGASGRIVEVLVVVGDRVEAGQPLARADQRELRLRAAQAEATLAQAQANADQLRQGATELEIVAAQAQLAQAQGQLLQVQGGVTAADITAAQAQLQQAQAALARLTGGPDQDDLEVAQAKVRDAELSLATQRDQLSQAKTSAHGQLDQAANALTQAQSRYSTAKQNWEYVQETGADPIVRRVSDPNRPGQTKPNTLNDSQRQQYYDAFVQAEASLHTAEENVAQAQVAYDNALRSEAVGVERAEGQLAIAQAQRDQVIAGADADQVAAARAQVAAARANLDKLGGDQRAGGLQAAQAAVVQAQAHLDQLRDGPRSVELDAAQAQVDSARAQLELAKLALEEATLLAPFGGEIAEVNLKVGELPNPALPAITLTNLERLHVNVTVDEVDISRIRVSQPVTLTLDALPGAALSGSIQSVAPLAVTQSAVTSYQVRIGIERSDPRVRPGMSTNADIIVDRRETALVLPRRAVRSDRGRLVVDVVRDAGLCALPSSQWPVQPDRDQREVQIGLSNEQLIEVLGGVTPGDCVYVEGVDARLNPLSGPPPGVRR